MDRVLRVILFGVILWGGSTPGWVHARETEPALDTEAVPLTQAATPRVSDYLFSSGIFIVTLGAMASATTLHRQHQKRREIEKALVAAQKRLETTPTVVSLMAAGGSEAETWPGFLNDVEKHLSKLRKVDEQLASEQESLATKQMALLHKAQQQIESDQRRVDRDAAQLTQRVDTLISKLLVATRRIRS